MQLLSTKIIKSIKLNKEESLSFDKWSRFLTIEGDNILPEKVDLLTPYEDAAKRLFQWMKSTCDIVGFRIPDSVTRISGKDHEISGYPISLWFKNEVDGIIYQLDVSWTY